MIAQATLAYSATIAKIHTECFPSYKRYCSLEASEDKAAQPAQMLQQVMEQAGQRYLRKMPVKAAMAIALNWSEK